METAELTSVAIYAGIALFAVFAVFFLGKQAGQRMEVSKHRQDAKQLDKQIALIEASKNELRREIDHLSNLNEKYLNFVVRIPETVKHLNSSLTFDEIISSLIRFTKDIIDTNCIELYIYNEDTRQMELEAAYRSTKKKRIAVPYGEGVIGKAAELRIITTRDSLLSGSKKSDESLYLGAPIMFRNRLIGVLGLGTISGATGNEKRLIAMVADLAGVSLQNCERLSSAQQEANTDPLTGLYNRKYFSERVLDEAQKAVSYNFSISIFLFDIDHFKKYNDTNGHAEGDYLLKELAHLLKINTRGRDVIVRYGGEEFIVLLPNTGKEGAYLYGEKIRKAIKSAPFRNREKQPLGCVSISGGVATYPIDGDTIEAVIKYADSALYKSKELGRNRVTKYEHTNLT